MQTVLLIESDPADQQKAKEILEMAGYQVLLCTNGKEAVSTAVKESPDIILSAMQVEGLDGFSILFLIQKQSSLVNTPFIFLTKDDSPMNFRRAMNSGAEDYLIKPFNSAELLGAVESHLQKRERIQSLMTAQSPSMEDSSLEKALNTLIETGKSNNYRKGQILFLEGNHPQHIFYLKSGKVKSYKTSESGKELTVQLYGPGDFVGYIALISQDTYSFTSQTLEDCELLLISRSEFLKMVRENRSFAWEVIRVLARHNNQKAERMLQLAYNSLRKRVANTLLMLKSKFHNQKETSHFSIRMTREELANISGTTTESLIRTLSDFKEEGLIQIDGRSIEILEESRLQNLYD